MESNDQTTNPQPPQEAPAVPPAAPTPPQPPVAAPPTNEDPGKTLGIISLILPFVGLGVIGLVVGIIARSKSKAAGHSNGLALAGIVLSILNIVVGLAVIGLLVFGGSKLVQKCQELGPGTHFVDGVSYTCS